MLNAIMASMGITDRDLIESVIGSCFFADFGVVLGTDQTTVDVRHAIRPVVAGERLGETVTKGVEVLWPSSAQFSVRWTLAVGDTVLLVGLKDFVRTVSGDLPSGTDVPLHYSKETMKAVPMGAFRSDAEATLQVSGGKVKLDATEIDLNGDSKALVTHGELNTALQTFLTALKAAVAAGCQVGAGGTIATVTLDIGAAATTTLKTGG